MAMGKVYVTHRQEPERRALAEDVTDSLSAVSGHCQLSVSISPFLSVHLFVLSVPVNLLLHAMIRPSSYYY